MNRRLVIRYAIRESMGLLVMGVALFGAAGTIDWRPAWAALAVMAVWIAATAVVIFRLHPSLLAERLGPRRDTKPWDTAILGVMGLTQLVRYIVAGLDRRFNWTGGWPVESQVAALVVCVLGYALFVWATASNPFFSQTVRIQTERGHTVATGGPYRYVRHPAYVGAILYELAVPVLLASFWACALSGLSTILLILRTVLEDRTLNAELAAYVDYAHQVRYRLVPGIW